MDFVNKKCIDILGSSTCHSSRNNGDSEPVLEGQADNNKENIKDEIDIIYKSFEQFDIVDDHSDHHFKSGPSQNLTTQEWSKRIQYEWKILMEHLPKTIYVRAYEGRMDLMRAVIIGADGTPYHDGLFFFDVFFPRDYPNEPPCLHYHSAGLVVNTNLHPNGVVCLSLLNTWIGFGCESWIPWSSTMLQVLVSIQGLILNAKPYNNELITFRYKASLAARYYNNIVFLGSCRTMLCSMRRPPLHFEDFVGGHFRERGHTILAAIVAYMKGAPVGGDDFQRVGHSRENCNLKIKCLLSEVFDDLLEEFNRRGAHCEEIAAERINHGANRQEIAAQRAKDALNESIMGVAVLFFLLLLFLFLYFHYLG